MVLRYVLLSLHLNFAFSFHIFAFKSCTALRLGMDDKKINDKNKIKI